MLKLLARLRSSCRRRGRNSVPGATSGTSTLAETSRGPVVGNTSWPAGQGAGQLAGYLVVLVRNQLVPTGLPVSPYPGPLILLPVVVVRPSGRPARSCHVPLTDNPHRSG